MKRFLLALLACASLGFVTARAAGLPPADSAAIKATALDYVEGWYAGDAARMERALHPDLAKRQVARTPAAPPASLP